MTLYFVSDKYSDMCCGCYSVFKNAELTFPLTHSEIYCFPCYVIILLASRLSAYKKMVSRVKHMLSLMLLYQLYFMTLC
jgi:hypothetical protein